MENEAGNKFTWVIKDFSNLITEYIYSACTETTMGNEGDNKLSWVIRKFKSDNIYSDIFVIGGLRWYLILRPRETYLSLSLVVADSQTLPCGWRRHTKYRLTVVNQLSEENSQVQEKQHWFDQKSSRVYYPEMIPSTKFLDKEGGFLVNNEVKIIAEVEVLEVIGKLDVSEKSQEVTQPLKKTKLNDDGVGSSHLHKKTSSVKESIDVNGFKVLPSQAESVKRIFEKHPNMALEFRAKSQYLRTSSMNVLLDLIKTLCQSLHDLSTDDLCQADSTLTYIKKSGFKVDWLEQKLEEVKDKKIKEEIDVTRMQELEEEWRDLKEKCSNTEALLKKQKVKVLSARAPPLTMDDFV